MRAIIALGANIGDPKEQMDLAVAMLREATDFKGFKLPFHKAR